MNDQLRHGKEGIQLVLQSIDMGGKGEDKNHFSKFGGLDAQSDGIKPNPAAVAGVSFGAKGDDG